MRRNRAQGYQERVVQVKRAAQHRVFRGGNPILEGLLKKPVSGGIVFAPRGGEIGGLVSGRGRASGACEEARPFLIASKSVSTASRDSPSIRRLRRLLRVRKTKNTLIPSRPARAVSRDAGKRPSRPPCREPPNPPCQGNYIHDSTVGFRSQDSQGNDITTPPLRGCCKSLAGRSRFYCRWRSLIGTAPHIYAALSVQHAGRMYATPTLQLPQGKSEKTPGMREWFWRGNDELTGANKSSTQGYNSPCQGLLRKPLRG